MDEQSKEELRRLERYPKGSHEPWGVYPRRGNTSEYTGMSDREIYQLEKRLIIEYAD